MKEMVTDWFTIEFSEAGEWVQPEEEWADLEDYRTMAVMEQIPWFRVTAPFTLMMHYETTRSREGPWEPVGDPRTAGPAMADQYASTTILGRGTDVASRNRVERYLRIRVVATGPAEVCLRWSAILK